MISIVIPAYNEAQRLGTTLKHIRTYCKAELIVIDDGSTDNTSQVARRHKATVLRNPTNKGKGYSVRRGMLHAKHNRILFTDADLSTPIEELTKLLQYKEDIVIGSRALKTSNVVLHQPWYREYSGKLFNLIVQVLAVPGIKDTQCGFKLFTKQAARNVFKRTTIDGFGFDVEALFIARKLGYHLREVPITWKNDEHTKVNLLKDSIRMFTDLLRIRLNDLRRMY